jgi:hypothetical protein
MSIKHLYLVGVATAIACAPPGGTAGSTGAPERSTLLTADEITAVGPEGKTAYDVVSRLRPKWLRAHGPESLRGESDSSEFALVIVDSRQMGRIQALRDVDAYQVADIHFYEPAVSNGKFGPRGASGVIEVRTKTTRQ